VSFLSDAGVDAVDLLGMRLAPLREDALLDHVFSALARGQGGWIVTANLDILRRYRKDPEARALYDDADVRVADGMPLVWASRVRGTPLPERVTGSGLTPRLVARAAREGRSLYLLGGAPGAAEEAIAVFERDDPGLRVTGFSSPMVGSPPTEEEVRAMLASLGPERPDILLVGLGSPKQEHVIRALRAALPTTWFVGVGISFSFAAGHVKRAPVWMQQAGLEWVHRLTQEPGRLARRYLVDDLPFAAVLFGGALRDRLTGKR